MHIVHIWILFCHKFQILPGCRLSVWKVNMFIDDAHGENYWSYQPLFIHKQITPFYMLHSSWNLFCWQQRFIPGCDHGASFQWSKGWQIVCFVCQGVNVHEVYRWEQNTWSPTLRAWWVCISPFGISGKSHGDPSDQDLGKRLNEWKPEKSCSEKQLATEERTSKRQAELQWRLGLDVSLFDWETESNIYQSSIWLQLGIMRDPKKWNNLKDQQVCKGTIKCYSGTDKVLEDSFS